MPERHVGGTVLGMSMAKENAGLREQNAEPQREGAELRAAFISLQGRIQDSDGRGPCWSPLLREFQAIAERYGIKWHGNRLVLAGQPVLTT